MSAGKFRKPPQAPPSFTATPESVVKDTKEMLAESKKITDEIVAEISQKDATFKNVVLPMAVDENRQTLKAHILGFYQSVSTDQELRDASTEAEKLMDDFGIEAAMREDVFQLVDAALKRDEKLDPESQRLLEKEHKGFVRNGLNIPAGPKRDRFKEIKKRLSQLGIAFSKNLNEEKGGIWFTAAELEGVPEDVLSLLKKEDDKYFLTFKYPDLFPTLKYATNAATRQKVFIANENKCNQNAPLFREAIILRDEAARLLGYPNHAAFRIEDKMAKTPKTVDDFLGDLRHRLSQGGLDEIETLKKLKEDDLKSKGESFDGRYYLWDHRFYDRVMEEKDYQLDQQLIAEYFPLQTTIKGMLEIFEQIFGLAFVEIVGKDRDAVSPSGKGNDIVWHEEVQVFSVWDDEAEGAGFVGYLYLDLFPRTGKYGHAANFNLQPGFIQENGTRRYPATALVCNFSKPTAKKPSLLKHDEVTTLFHELGHGIHDLVSRTTYSRFHGTNTVRDFVEAPSQMLENWCWTPSQLKALSRHYSTLSSDYYNSWQESSASKGEKPEERIPDDLIQKLIKTKNLNGALFNLRQLHFGIFDMTIHEPKDHASLEKMNISETYNSLRKDISKIDGPEVLGEGNGWGNGQATFGHLMGGYDAGYYGYLSSQVYSTDMFYTVFKKDPMDPKEGRRYRHTVLERGGSQDEMQTLIDFLGREPKTDAFYEELGLTKGTQSGAGTT
ncbi:metalloendopeptidase [Elasticomyces elasticus]|uniref:Metalloendopeptidase n=1 Tax=Exophiala sideris TaxID=1016849 RepID=A0ABR0J6J1_9EURO|nr:metalloendopeptidase [Elasticomyces elasticus]KAK5028940.1 metalloendopeptidase [Exophiala sideris]KAK5035809.1 metalloendopeptidase [Exophiala sideris]KAK5057444.1 metalloendopeptidase [Exophiala sideris]KAK5181581.1 metalloendopeptidase [Eurotiomycetes sp. CCFEE 6388]